MGGSGSGIYGARLKEPKITVEQCKSLKIDQVKNIIDPNTRELPMRIDKDGESQNQVLGIDWTDCNFGGKRPWFVCPGCEDRKGKLYFRHEEFLCRTCHDLAYRRTQISGDRVSELDWKIQKVCRRLGILDEGWLNNVIPLIKPKNMHQTVYFRLLIILMYLKEKRTQEQIRKWKNFRWMYCKYS
ncbi:hypothetical protein [Alteribacter keqinensis]|uniref:Uncharacterized protein n=1 Tax=Alteribacter keqinensis TaxID=2483800 RepID=A0A3M7TKX7_9BACI|nr:hypothetical protein [Alteribacter keqinensis]RNA66209.1 hypothetical protein EBO34_18945 [Alteribacter keqinensis]